MRIRVAHSPDPDDAFMFYPMVKGLIDTEGLEVEHILLDIETLNEEAMKGSYEVSAVSVHAYPYIADKYLVLPSGGSFGEGYGPVVVAKERIDLKGKKVAVPGRFTTAFLVLKLFEPDFEPLFLPFDRVLEAVEKGEAEAGVLIHEGQLTYNDRGLLKVVDLGEWWKEETGLPLPLGCNVVRRDLGLETIRKVERVMRRSVEKALTMRKEALSYALDFARGLDQERTDKFVSMYVNGRTLDCGEEGKRAVRELLKRGREEGIIEVEVPEVIFSDEV